MMTLVTIDNNNGDDENNDARWITRQWLAVWCLLNGYDDNKHDCDDDDYDGIDGDDYDDDDWLLIIMIIVKWRILTNDWLPAGGTA